MATPEGRTADGFETQFGINHLAHFLLIQPRFPRWSSLASCIPEDQSRIVILSSAGHRNGDVNFSNLNLEGGIYYPWVAYGQSKTANIYTATEIERRYGFQGVHAWVPHHGHISTGILQHLDEDTLESWAADTTLSKVIKDAGQDAATTVWAATAKALEGTGVKYLEECQISGPAPLGAREYDGGYADYVYDEKKENMLWAKSMELVKPFLA